MSFKRVRSLPSIPTHITALASSAHHEQRHHSHTEHSQQNRPQQQAKRGFDPDMEVDGSIRVGNKRASIRPGSRPFRVCSFWREGRCNRDPCNFLHSEDPDVIASYTSSSSNGKRSSVALAYDDGADVPQRNVWGTTRGGSKAGQTFSGRTKPCTYFLRGNCTKGSKCNFSHTYSSTTEITFMTRLEGHEKTVRAIALPQGASKLYSGGQDQMIRAWDCDTGQCVNVVPMGGDIWCLLTEASWLFVGLPNEVKALNLQTSSEQRLEGPKGQIHVLAVCKDMLLAGAQDGSIYAWKYDPVSNLFQPVATLPSHTGAVVTLEVADGKLYSGSMDKTIKVWDLTTGHCLQTITGHSNVVMGLLCWNQYLLSGSLDGTVKVWSPGQNGAYELQYTHSKDSGSSGVLALCGFVDQHNKDILMCAYADDTMYSTVHLFELPSFKERGVMFTSEEVRVLQVGPGGLIFSGDAGGGVKVWKWVPAQIQLM